MKEATTILVPGGIGDIYWILVKLQSFCQREGITGKPEVIILDDGIFASSRIRSVPFLEMVPFIAVGDPPTIKMYPNGPINHKYRRRVFSTVSIECGQMIYPGFMGHDYFICFNGIINTGHYLEEVDSDLECNWYFPMDASDEQKKFQSECQEKYGPYAVFFFSLIGDFVNQNVAQFSLDQMAESINLFTSVHSLTPVFIGAWWDLKFPGYTLESLLPVLISKIPKAVNLVGQTSLDQAFGIMKGAELVSGYHCGLTNMAIAFKKKTVLLWSPDRFPKKTPLAVAPPDTRMVSYIPLYTKGLTVGKYTGTMEELLCKS